MFTCVFSSLSVLALSWGASLAAAAAPTQSILHAPVQQGKEVQQERKDVEEDTDSDEDVMIMEEDEDSSQD
ncbi:MAG: hypothetical protein HYZ48_00460 [Chlamydiales bacterium]|nr:hypothetical protein [Chlamydiales bacterium]